MTAPIQVSASVQADQPTERYHPLWNWFGYDEPNYTYSPHGKKLLGELTALSNTPPHIRTHNLLTSGDGVPALKWGSTNAYTEDAQGNPVYDWTIMDKIFDAYVEAGNAPLVQIGFTPEALSDFDGDYKHHWEPADKYATIMTGWASPPNDLKKWGELVYAWARHLADRYGEEKVSSWPWEVWNEPDGLYWHGTIPDYCEMYDVSAKAVKRALPKARVGGPHTCGGFSNPKAQTFLRQFLQYVVDHNSPIDFIAFHAKGNPVIWQDHVRMGLHKQLRDIETNLDIINEFPSLTHLPIIIGESDPEGCAACSARVHPQNGYRNGPLYGVYVVQSMIRTYELARMKKLHIEGAVTWAFLFDDQAWYDGFRDLATNGVDKAVLNGFRMLGKLDGDWLASQSSHRRDIVDIMEHGVRGEPDVNVVATRDDKGVSILVWHYHDDDAPGPDAEVTITVNSWGDRKAALKHFRMDETHSNSFGVWKAMGRPENPEGADYARLEASGQLAQIDAIDSLPVSNGAIALKTTLPRQGVSLLRLDW